jgi:hypothetical protein
LAGGEPAKKEASALGLGRLELSLLAIEATVGVGLGARERWDLLEWCLRDLVLRFSSSDTACCSSEGEAVLLRVVVLNLELAVIGEVGTSSWTSNDSKSRSSSSSEGVSSWVVPVVVSGGGRIVFRLAVMLGVVAAELLRVCREKLPSSVRKRLG